MPPKKVQRMTKAESKAFEKARLDAIKRQKDAQRKQLDAEKEAKKKPEREEKANAALEAFNRDQEKQQAINDAVTLVLANVARIESQVLELRVLNPDHPRKIDAGENRGLAHYPATIPTGLIDGGVNNPLQILPNPNPYGIDTGDITARDAIGLRLLDDSHSTGVKFRVKIGNSTDRSKDILIHYSFH